MALKTVVKVGGITNLSDARYCAGMGVDLLGFNIDLENIDYVTPESFSEITGWVSGIKLVVETSAVQLADLDNYTFSFIQVNSQSQLSEVFEKGCNVILVVDINDYTLKDLLSLGRSTSEIVAYYLFENIPDSISTGMKVIESFAKQYPVLLGFNINSDNIDYILDTKIMGIAMHGSSEEKPGMKTYDELADVLEALEEEVD